MRSPIYIDIGEFFSNPIRTGIQRVVRQLIAHWPSDTPRVYVRYDVETNTLVEVPDRLIRYICQESQQGGSSPVQVARHASLLQHAQGLRFIELVAGDRVLVPELFYDERRVSFYAGLEAAYGAQAYLTIFDFMPWLRPDLYRIGPASARHIMPYLRLTTSVRHRCFISAATRDDFVLRIARGSNDDPGPVIALGSDGLGLAKQNFDSSKTDLVCIGTLEGKKHQEIVFEAFRGLPRPRSGRLHFLGKVPRDLAPWLRELVDYRGADVEIIDGPSDAVLRHHVSRARASVFVSTSEGFGLPAVESLYCGLPVIAHAALPALANILSLGQLRLPAITPAAIGTAMSLIEDDSEAARLWAEASELMLPTWRDYARNVASWVRAG